MKISLVLISVFLFPLLTLKAQKLPSKPNIIVIYTDDMGYADIGEQGSVSDIRTPNIDDLAKTGVRFTNGYVTAPQCSPSRAGLITGRYQQRFGLDNISDCPLTKSEITIADRLKKAGYTTGQVGKWHLEPNITSVEWAKDAFPGMQLLPNGRIKQIPDKLIKPYMPGARGFDQYFSGYINDYDANYSLNGEHIDLEGEQVNQPGFRLEIQTNAALEFLKRNHNKPFFLYLAYYGPHVPLEATKKYLDRFPGPMPERRRTALAMISAIDDGVGQIRELLKKHNLDKNTLIIFSSDNGAPLGITKEDLPITNVAGKWDGSLNDPFKGEKGMLSEGGIRVPFIINMEGLPKGLIFDKPVSTLDITATSIALAGLNADKNLDGVNLIPFLNNKNEMSPHPDLFWRFWDQSAIRSGKWKLIIPGNKEVLLFNLEQDPTEKNNISTKEPVVVKKLKKKLKAWTLELNPPGINKANLNTQEIEWYKYYFGI